MKKTFHFFVLLIFVFLVSASAMAEINENGNRSGSFIKNSKRIPDQALQEGLRTGEAWQNFTAKHQYWRVHFNEENAKPHRAFGAGIATTGATADSRAMNFILNELGEFDIPIADLRLMGTGTSPRHNYVNYYQEYNGLKVLYSRLMVKMTKDYKVVMFGADVFSDLHIGIMPALSPAQAEQAALNSTAGSGLTVTTAPELAVLPVPIYRKNEYKLVYEVVVNGTDAEGLPASFYTLVDAMNGSLLQQFNRYHTNAPKANVEATVTADIYPMSPYDAPVNKPLRDLRIKINGTDYFTDTAGVVTTGITTAASGTAYLDGPWAKITSNANGLPSFTVSLAAGPNAVSFNNDALDTERNAFYHINVVHDWVNEHITGFTGMDYQVTVNMDETGTCNASFGGGQMNFFLQGGGCYSFATIGDIVYHEYGHGINSAFYSANAAFFNNGAMGEGYADVWGLSITENPILGEGMSDTDPNEYVRRYDIDPKIYPNDLVGEVHADGEIIAGAWWDLYLNLGSNMEQTMDLFEEAYYGLQATAADGNEGQAFRDVLLDVLQADDDDADLTNGTPNITAICDAFGKHGITLISNATLSHSDVTSAGAGQPISIDATLNLGVSPYLGDVMLYYRLKGSPSWTGVAMVNTGGSNYQGDVPAQAPGDIVEYYLGVTDNTCGNLSAVQPIGANADDPTLPYYILVDYQQEAIEDFDNNSLPGSWTYGLITDDATTGIWSLEVPTGMYDNGYEMAPTTQFTPGGYSCVVTQLNTDANGSVGEKDVDGGTTAVVTPPMDLTGYLNPVITYRRWFSNASPSSANPGNDPWYVAITSDGSTWVPVEFTYVGDNNWRRFAFNVEDFVPLTANVQVKFQASDSTILALGPPGCLSTPFCGGSLVEAALDDIAIWSQMSQPVTFTVAGVSCNGVCDGEVTAVPDGGAGPYQYLWDDPASQTAATATGLCGGSYEVRVIDALNDTLYASVNLAIPAALSATASGTNSTCSSCNDGTATVSATGGTAPYFYVWNDVTGQTTSTAAGLAGGAYVCVVTDANGCSFSSGTVTISVGIAEAIAAGSVRLYPNPVTDRVNLSFILLKRENVKVRILGYTGAEVYAEDLGRLATGGELISLPMEELSPGVYTIELIIGGTTYNYKVGLIR